MSPRVLAFDVHNTLAHWPQGRMSALEVQHLLGRLGVEISFQAFEAARQAAFFLDGPRRAYSGWMDFFAVVFSRMGVSISTDVLASLVAAYEPRDTMVAFPDAAPAVERAKNAGFVTCAFTTLPRFMVTGDAGALVSELHHFFDGAACGYPKGHPAFYRTIAEKLGIEGCDIACLGDDPYGDCLLPAEAGWRPYLLCRGGARVRSDLTCVESPLEFVEAVLRGA